MSDFNIGGLTGVYEPSKRKVYRPSQDSNPFRSEKTIRCYYAEKARKRLARRRARKEKLKQLEKERIKKMIEERLVAVSTVSTEVTVTTEVTVSTKVTVNKRVRTKAPPPSCTVCGKRAYYKYRQEPRYNKCRICHLPNMMNSMEIAKCNKAEKNK